jgi:hypothetical protein
MQSGLKPAAWRFRSQGCAGFFYCTDFGSRKEEESGGMAAKKERRDQCTPIRRHALMIGRCR